MLFYSSGLLTQANHVYTQRGTERQTIMIKMKSVPRNRKIHLWIARYTGHTAEKRLTTNWIKSQLTNWLHKPNAIFIRNENIKNQSSSYGTHASGVAHTRTQGHVLQLWLRLRSKVANVFHVEIYSKCECIFRFAPDVIAFKAKWFITTQMTTYQWQCETFYHNPYNHVHCFG